MIIIKTTLISILLVASTIVNAEFKKDIQFNVVFQGYAFHTEDKYTKEDIKKYDPEHPEYNEKNKAFGIEVVGQKHGFIAGVYHDSYFTRAKYIGGVYLPLRTKYVDFGIQYGLITSPSYAEGAILPLLVPYMVLHAGYVGVNVMYLPKFTANGSHVLGFQLKIML